MSETSDLPPLPSPEVLSLKIRKLKACLKALAQPIRMQILFLLHKKEMNVNDITMALTPISQPSVSRCLGELRDQRLVNLRRDGKYRYNSLTQKCREFLDAFLDQSDPEALEEFQKIGMLKPVKIED
jgi:DNA-binding transcriptional ArsR family regulator